MFEGTFSRTAHAWVIIILLDVAYRLGPLVPQFDRFELGLLILVLQFYATGAATRGLLRDRMGLWVLDRGCAKYIGITLLLFLPPTLVMLVATVLLHSSDLGKVLAIPVIIVLLRYFLWPIGLLIGYRAMTASESARLMSGRLLSVIGALLLVSLCIVPVIALLLIPEFWMTETPTLNVVDQTFWAVASGLITIATASIWAAMYKLTADRAEAS